MQHYIKMESKINNFMYFLVLKKIKTIWIVVGFLHESK